MVIVDLKVPSEYGYCILVAVGSGFVLAWKALQVRPNLSINVFYVSS